MKQLDIFKKEKVGYIILFTFGGLGLLMMSNFLIQIILLPLYLELGIIRFNYALLFLIVLGSLSIFLVFKEEN